MLKRYGLFGSLKLAKSLLFTKIFYPKAKLIRLPFDIRNKRFIQMGKNFTTGFGCRIEAFPLPSEIKTCIQIGDNVQINDYVHITAMEKVRIGNNVLIASKVYISDCSHGSYAGDKNDSSPLSIPKDRKLFSKGVEIEDNVWIGEFVSILPGVYIGKGTIVGANSVVSRSLPANVIAVGTPAIPIKRYNFETQHWEKI